MSIVLLLARVLLALVFFVAGFAKLADLAGSRQALRDFGVPAALVGPFGLLLPIVELAVAVTLLPAATAWWGVLGAVVLLLLFVAGISSNLARGRTPDCHCFGQLHSAPAGPATLIRNLVLAALAGIVVGFGRSTPGPGVFDWLAALTTPQRIEVLAGVGVLALLMGEGWVLFQIMSQQGRLLLRLEALDARLSEAPSRAAAGTAGLAVGTPAPSFTLPALTGEPTALEALRTLGKPVVLVFSDPGCGPCNALLPEIGRWQHDHANKLVVALISRGTVEANRSKGTESGLRHVLLQKDREVAQAYQAAGTPSAVLVRRDGTIGSPLAQGADAIRALIEKTLSPAGLAALPMAAAPAQHNGNGAHARPRPIAPAIGEPAPEFGLPDLAGQMVHLSDFRGHTTLILFWRPGCGFCQRMLTDLKAWEARAPEGAPRLLMVSSESVESNKAMGLRSPVLLDQAGMSVGGTFGASGTPMAIVVDAEGKIASALAAGAPAVLALAHSGLDTIASA